MVERKKHAHCVDDGARCDKEPLPTEEESPVVTSMSKGSLYLPTVPIAAHSAAIVCSTLRSPVVAMRRQQPRAHGCCRLAKRVTVVRLVSDQIHWPEIETPTRCLVELLKHRLDQFGFSDRRRSADSREGNALLADDELYFDSLPAFREPDLGTPFFAALKVASMYVSSVVSRPCSISLPSDASQMARHTPSSSHSFKRRQHVGPLGKGGGRSRQRAPERSTQIIPSTHSRLPRHGRPRRSLRTLGLGSMGSIAAHCSSVRIRDMRLAIPEQKAFCGQKYKYHVCLYL